MPKMLTLSDNDSKVIVYDTGGEGDAPDPTPPQKKKYDIIKEQSLNRSLNVNKKI